MESSVQWTQDVVTHVFTVSAIISLSFVVGESFFLILFFQYLLCKVIDGSKNTSLSAALILGGILFAEFSALVNLIPAIWNDFSEVVHLFLVQSFMITYFVWCIKEFHIFREESEILELTTHSIFPSVCSVIISLHVYVITSWNPTIILCSQGFCTLWICSHYKPLEKFEESWHFLLDCCNLILLRILPFITTIIPLFTSNHEDEFFTYGMKLILLYSGTNFLSGLIPYRGKLFNIGNLTPRTALVLSLISTVSLLLNHIYTRELIKNRPDVMLWLIPQGILFVGLLGTLIRNVSTSFDWNHRLYRILSVVLALCLFVAYLIPLDMSFRTISGPGHVRFLSRTPFFLGVCAACSVMALVAYTVNERDLFEAVFVLCLWVFHFVEWRLYETMIIPASRVIQSTFFIGLGALILHVCSQYNTNSRLTHPRGHVPTIRLSSKSLITANILVPSLTKFTLLGLNYWHWQEDAMILTGSGRHQDAHRIRFERGTIMGIFLNYLGLLLGSRLLRLSVTCARIGCGQLTRWRGSTLKPVRCSISLALCVSYFAVPLYFIWSPCIRSVFGVVPQNHVLIIPLAVLIAGISILLQRNSGYAFFDTDQLRTYCLRCMETSFGFLGFVVLSGRLLNCTWSFLFLFSLAGSGLVFLFWLISHLVPDHGKITTGSRVTFPRLSWLFLTVRLGVLIGLSMLTLIIWLNASQLTDSLIFPCVAFATCLSGLVVLRYVRPDHPRVIQLTDKRQPSEASSTAPEVVKLPNTSLPTNPSNSANCKTHLPLFVEQREVPDMEKPMLRFKILLFLLGSGFLCLTWLSHEPSELGSSDRQLIATVSLALFTLGQVASGRSLFIAPLNVHSTVEQKHKIRRDWLLQVDCFESALLACLVNGTVFVVIWILYQTFLWTHSDLEILFLPCLLFGLSGKRVGRYRLVAPLFALTLVLLCSTWLQSHMYHSSRPPLPTFTRSMFRLSTSKWPMWIETLLTSFLVPVHILFLTDLAGWSTEDLMNVPLLMVPRRFLATRSAHSLKESHRCCTQCVWLRVAHLLSQLCALVLCATHVLTLACLAYLFVASSFASALYGMYSFGVCVYLLLNVDIVTEI